MLGGGKRSQRFALGGDGDEDDGGLAGALGFTHNGRALGEDGVDAADGLAGGVGSDSDDDGMGQRLTQQLQFGGGYEAAQRERAAAKLAAEGGEVRKSKREAMAELIAKSKAFKAQRQMLKEEDEELRTQLDDTFRELAAAGALKARPDGRGPMGATPRKREAPDDYDKAAKALGMEARGRAGDRTKTAEEVAEEQRQRLEELEEQRQRRMRGELSSDDEDGDDEGGEAAGRPARKVHDASGDGLDENFVLSDEEDDESESDDESGEDEEDGGVAGAAGDDEDELGEDYESGSGEDEGDLESGEEAGDYDSGEEDEIEARIAEAIRLKQQQAKGGKAGTAPPAFEQDEAAFEQDDSEGEEEIEGATDGQATAAAGRGKKTVTGEVMAAAKSALPFTIPAPASYKEFALLVRGRPAAELAEAISRVRACNAVQLGADNRRKLQTFYGVLLSHYGAVADAVPLEQDKLDAMVRPVLEMTAQLPLYAATAARAHLLSAHSKLCDALERAGGAGARWPARRTMMLLKLLCMAFPVSDARHPVVTPAALLLGHALCLCPLRRAQHAAHALLSCQLAAHMTAPAGRFFPEAIVTLTQLLAGAAPEGALPPESAADAPARAAEPLLRVAEGDEGLAELVAADAGPADLALDFAEVLDAAEEAERGGAGPEGEVAGLLAGARYRLGVAAAATSCAARLAESLRELPSAAEALAPLAAALAACAESAGAWPAALRAHAGACGARVEAVRTACVASRKPLRMFADRAAAPTIRAYTPRFEDDFDPHANYDPDRERAEAKKLKRQVAKEARGAARELRKDNHFLSEERERRLDAEREEQQAHLKRGRALMEETEQAYRAGGGKRKKHTSMRDLKAAGLRR